MEATKFFVYTIDKKFIRVKGLALSTTKSIITYWVNKNHALSWERAVKRKYPKAKLEEAVLILKKVLK